MTLNLRRDDGSGREGAATAIISNRPVNMAHFTQKMAALCSVLWSKSPQQQARGKKKLPG